MSSLDGALVALALAAIGALIAAGRALQRIATMEEGLKKAQERIDEAKETADGELDAVRSLVTEHTTEPTTHRSADWEREIRGRLDKIEGAVEVIRTKTEASSIEVVRTLGEIRLEIARMSPSSMGGAPK